jgi:hypothetical protein
MGPRKDLAALAGIIAPVVFGFGIVALTVAQYDYMTGLGWRPFDDSSGVPWPSGLALGPLGFLQVANFVLFGVLLIFFALGLHRGVAPGARGSKAGPALLMVAGFAMVLAGFETDPDISGGPQTWHGLIHGLAYLLFVFSLLPVFFVLWRRLRRDPHWRGYDLVTLITGILYVVLFFVPGAVAFYLFLALVLVWIEVMALRLRALAVGASAARAAPAN